MTSAKAFLTHNDGPAYAWSNDNTRVLVTSAETEGRFTLLEDRMKPEFQLSRHMHRTHSETFHVLEGAVEFVIGDAEAIRGEIGAMIFIPPGVPHAVRVLDGKPARMLMIYAPGGFEGYLEAVSRLSEAESADPSVMAALNDAYDIVQLG